MAENKNKQSQEKLQERVEDKPKDSTTIEQWTSSVINEMDRFAMTRSMFIFAIVTFFLGNNLNLYLYFFMFCTIYMLILRFVRWWGKKWLLYMFEFCYFGITFLIVYLIFFPNEKVLWCMTYVYSTGHMAIAIILFNNQARFSSTDHISSAWLHSTPIVTVWAIRWREQLYVDAVLKKLTFDFVPESAMAITSNEERIKLLLITPTIFWVGWAAFYVLVFYIGCNSYIQDDNYKSGLDDFIAMAKTSSCIKCLVGDPTSNTKIKYLFQHFITNLISMPLSWLSYHYFAFNTVYILVLMIFLMWNASSQQNKMIEKKVEEKIAKKIKEETSSQNILSEPLNNAVKS